MYNKLKGENVTIIYDGDRVVAYPIDAEMDDEMSFEDRANEYINSTYWYLPKLDRRKVLLNHGISSVQVVNNFVFFETIVPNINYYKHIQKCREQFPTSIIINVPEGFMLFDFERIHEILDEQKK